MFSPQAVQEEWFEKQIQLAVEVKKPLFLHEREAHQVRQYDHNDSSLNILR
jgi:Tat protein secretion system quality control protein TatD with DNase activity